MPRKPKPQDARELIDQMLRADLAAVPWRPLINPLDPEEATPQRTAYESKADVLGYGGAAGGGKQLALTETVPTAEGRKAVGDVRVGDRLLDEQGQVCRVTALSPIDPAPRSYRLTFDDGSTVDACADHRWLTFDASEMAALTRRDPEWRARRRAKRPSRIGGKKSATFTAMMVARNRSAAAPCKPPPSGTVRSTQQIADTIALPNGRANHAIPLAAALELPEADLPVDPYVLGAWLGDGSSRGQGITIADPAMVVVLQAAGARLDRWSAPNAWGIYGIVARLRALHLLRNKHIPDVYLRASKAQRLALLQGLMDTDGTVARGSGAAEFTTTRPELRDGMTELIASLGWKVRAREGRAKLDGKDCGPRWTLKWAASEHVFRLPSKRALQRLATRRTTRFRYVKACEPIDPVPMRCLAVDSPSRLYLVGRSMIPTHNSDLLAGLALTQHKRSIILRRQYNQLQAIVDRIIEMRRTRDGYTQHPSHRFSMPDGRLIDLGGMQNLGDENSYQGRPYDFYGFDELPQFMEQQFRFVINWNRPGPGVSPTQRCRVVAAFNPPTSSDGDWIIPYWGPWLDDQHPDPAQFGELRWFAMIDGVEREVEGPDPILVPGEQYPVVPKSRTFIPSKIEDNPYLLSTGYRATLQALPEPLRSQMLRGDFHAGKADDPYQVIPTDWVDAAMERWTIRGTSIPRDVKMQQLGVDVARGGEAKTVLAPRYEYWLDELQLFPGASTPNGPVTASLVVAALRDQAHAAIDVCGPGGEVYGHLNGLGVPVSYLDGSKPSSRRNRSRSLGFFNKRAEWWWNAREMLDPANGEGICLPASRSLRADLCAPKWSLGPRGIKVEDKADTIKRIGRSPDEGDAVVYSLANESVMNAKARPYDKYVDRPRATPHSWMAA